MTDEAIGFLIATGLITPFVVYGVVPEAIGFFII